MSLEHDLCFFHIYVVILQQVWCDFHVLVQDAIYYLHSFDGILDEDRTWISVLYIYIVMWYTNVCIYTCIIIFIYTHGSVSSKCGTPSIQWLMIVLLAEKKQFWGYTMFWDTHTHRFISTLLYMYTNMALYIPVTST